MFTYKNGVVDANAGNDGELNVGDALNNGVALFEKEGLESDRLEVELLLAHAMHCSKTEIYLNYDRKLNDEHVKHFINSMALRLDHMPVQYILGCTEFMSLNFLVNRNVLIPRPETEFIVETVLDIVSGKCQCNIKDFYGNFVELPAFVCNSAKPVTIIDIGTGSGNIAVSLAVLLENSQIYACDISSAALNVARENSELHEVSGKITFLQGDMFGSLENHEVDLKADFIVSNPPYISEKELVSLQPEIVKYEPRCALVCGEDGVESLMRIINGAEDWLNDGGYLILEIGEMQIDKVKQIIDGGVNGLGFMGSVKDLQGIDRVVVARKIDISS